ncbi:unnamed protein product [Brugia timori]|uniref:Uncharacterized protein n=1 Tax=Brugia timori TaxID=42155 RepID=A0A3P7VY69_9BILA|nr:unnamed protein product [Brugia timori]
MQVAGVTGMVMLLPLDIINRDRPVAIMVEFFILIRIGNIEGRFTEISIFVQIVSFAFFFFEKVISTLRNSRFHIYGVYN